MTTPPIVRKAFLAPLETQLDDSYISTAIVPTNGSQFIVATDYCVGLNLQNSNGDSLAFTWSFQKDEASTATDALLALGIMKREISHLMHRIADAAGAPSKPYPVPEVMPAEAPPPVNEGR